MVRIQEAIVVEGRYDKNTLSQLVDTVILETAGFGVFKNKELVGLLRRLAETRGLIIFTDSDGAGFVIRNHLKGALPKEGVKQAYIPDVYGKEKRKRVGGKEGKLGVEGMNPTVLVEALRRCGATFLEETDGQVTPKAPITKADLFCMGLSGAGSVERRKRLMDQLDLPHHLAPNGLLTVLNALYSREELIEEVEQWN